MSRAFSTASRALKEINWKLNGTTEPVDWAKKNVETAVDKIAGLGDKVQDGIIKYAYLLAISFPIGER